jgi:hypothetical protein
LTTCVFDAGFIVDFEGVVWAEVALGFDGFDCELPAANAAGATSVTIATERIRFFITALLLL